MSIQIKNQCLFIEDTESYFKFDFSNVDDEKINRANRLEEVDYDHQSDIAYIRVEDMSSELFSLMTDCFGSELNNGWIE